MHPFVRKYHLKPADSIVVSKKNNPLVSHYAIYLGPADDGRELVMETLPGTGVRLSATCIFFRNYPDVRRVERFQGTEQDRLRRLRVAMRKLGRPYNLLALNCEHLASEVRIGKSSSPQVRRSLMVAAVLLMLRGLR
ncbi:MAG: hypothetical protein WBB45_13265 [Cyclobacteriaceae bacterium]